MFDAREMLNDLNDIYYEAERQEALWGIQMHPDGNSLTYKPIADKARKECQVAAETDTITWRHILKEEMYEAFAADNVQDLREELIQVAAVVLSQLRALRLR